MAYMILLDLLALIFSALVIGQVLYLVAHNMTVNECINWQRYPWLVDATGKFQNKYDRGCLRNYLDFCGLWRRSRQLQIRANIGHWV